MRAASYKLNFEGGLLQRGFWLYVWEITVPDGTKWHYVGRTGDSSSTNAQSPFNRMGQHLGFSKANNMLRQHLQGKDIAAEKCDFRLVAHGPILEEATTKDEHRKRLAVIAALEKELADALTNSGCSVLNTVQCRKKPDQNLWKQVHDAFAEHFPELKHKI